MKITPTPLENPFTRAHFLRPSLHSSSVTMPRNEFQSDPSLYTSKVQHYPLNIWTFRSDHGSNFTPLYTSRANTEISSFEKSLMVSGANSRRAYRRDEPVRTNRGYAGIQDNPFHRKNLLISREQIEEEVEKDLSRAQYKYTVNYSPPRSRPHSRNNSYQPNPEPERNSQARQFSNNNSLIMNLNNQQKTDIIKHIQAFADNASRTSLTVNNNNNNGNSNSNYKDSITVRRKVYYRANVALAGQ